MSQSAFADTQSVATTGPVCAFPTRARVGARAALEQAEELRRVLEELGEELGI